LAIGASGLVIQFVIDPLIGRPWDQQQILLVGAEFIALGCRSGSRAGFSSSRSPRRPNRPVPRCDRLVSSDRRLDPDRLGRGRMAELSPEQEQVAEVVEQRVLHRVARWLLRRSTIRAIGYTLFIVALTLSGWLVVRKPQLARTCHSRQEFRAELITVIRLALQDVPAERPVVIRLNEATKPGGPLGPIDC
jgi:hypothetical protein